MLTVLLVTLVLVAIVQAWLLVRTAIARNSWKPRGESVAVGAATNFFDTLGIGSFAPTLAWLKLRTSVPDRIIPCTMIVSHTLPTLVQAIIFLTLLGVHVDPVLLVGSGVAFLMGGLMGVPLVARARIWLVRAVVGCRAAGGRRALRARQPGFDARRRERRVASARADRDRCRRIFPDGDSAQFRGRQLCALPDHAQPDGSGPAPRLPDHGSRRFAHRRRSKRTPYLRRLGRPRPRSASRSAAFPPSWSRPSSSEHAGRDASLAGDPGRRLCRPAHAPSGVEAGGGTAGLRAGRRRPPVETA